MCFRNFISAPIKSRVPFGVFSWGGAARIGNSEASAGMSILSELLWRLEKVNGAEMSSIEFK